MQEVLHVGLRRVAGQPVVEALHPDLFGRLLLAADVHGARRVVAHEDRREPRRAPVLGGERRDLAGDLGADLRGDRLPVDDPRPHGGAAIY